MAVRVKCVSNVKTLSIAIFLYAEDHDGRYPDEDTWCDSIGEYLKADWKPFLCVGAEDEYKPNLSHYALNPNCEPNSPPDTVLIFETKAGWNQHGGPKLLTTENHEGVGCSVAFADGGTEFVKAEQLANLNWGTEEKDE